MPPKTKSPRRLDELPPGTQARVWQIAAKNPALRSRLLALGFTANSLVTMVSAAPLKDPLVIGIGNRFVSMRRSEAKEIAITSAS